MKKLLAAGIAALAVALVVAACGGGGSTTTGPSSAASQPAPPPPAAPALTVATRSGPLGTYLVDGQGKTLYLFAADKGTTSTCNGACASVWPPANTSGPPTAGPGVTASKLGTTMRSDGRLEATYNGHPLYYYVTDTQPGQTNGQGLNQFGALWYVLAPSGNAIVGKAQSSPSPSTPTTPSTGGGGY